MQIELILVIILMFINIIISILLLFRKINVNVKLDINSDLLINDKNNNKYTEQQDIKLNNRLIDPNIILSNIPKASGFGDK